MYSFRLNVVIGVCALILALGATGSNAEESAWSVPSATNKNFGSFSTLALDGIKFNLNQEITVTDLGWYDHPWSSDGMDYPVQIGIYNASNQSLLVSGTLPAGTASEKIDNFRYIPVTLTTLTPGTYMLAGLFNGSEPTQNVTPGTSLLENSVLQTTGWYSAMPFGFAYPDTLLTTTTRSMGANFQFVPVPEPTSLCLLGAGAFTLCRRRR